MNVFLVGYVDDVGDWGEHAHPTLPTLILIDTEPMIGSVEVQSRVVVK